MLLSENIASFLPSLYHSVGKGDDNSEGGHFSIILDSFSGSFLTAKVRFSLFDLSLFMQ